jgi:uncharacterized protein (TIGR03067 family)
LIAFFTPSSVRADDLDEMQGTWKVVSGKAGDKVATADQLRHMRFEFDGKQLVFTQGINMKETVKITLHPNKDPKEIDFTKGKAGAKGLWHGIYEFDGKKLRICFAPVEHDRPKSFSPKKEQQVYVLEKR